MMTSSDSFERSALVGRFVVRFDGATQTGLAAHEVQALLADRPAEVLEIYRIHRAWADGRTDLVGVAPGDFATRDCMLFYRRHVRDARADYDALVAYAARRPPPCRIDARLGRVQGPPASSVAVLVYPAACGGAVGQWLAGSGLELGDRATGSPAELTAYEDAAPMQVRHRVLEPAPSDRSGRGEG